MLTNSENVLLDSEDLASPESAPDDREDIRIHPILQLAQLCDYEAAHSNHVSFLALRLFDELYPLHLLGVKERFWLNAGGLLHDIGWIEGGRSHHKTSMRIILTTSMLPFSNKERLIVGSIARYHRKSLPKQKHDNFAALTTDEQRQTTILAAFLRLADGLDRDHYGQIIDLKCQIDAERIRIAACASQPVEALLLVAAHKSDLLAKVFNRSIQLVWEPV